MTSKGLFISHAHVDKKLIAALKTLIDDLYAKHFDVFATAVTPLEGGTLFREAIRQSLDNAGVVLVIITPQSFHKEWVLFEAGAAWLDTDTKEKILIPCRHNYPDFSSPLSEFQGVNLLDKESIGTVLITALNRVSNLHPNDKFVDMAVAEFLNNTRVTEISEDEVTAPKPLPEALQLLELISIFFEKDPQSAIDFAKMLLHRKVLINQTLFEKFLIELESK